MPVHALATQPASVVKRSGETMPFDGEKIRVAVERAGKATGEFDGPEAQLLAIQAVKVIAHRFHEQPPNI